VVGIDRPEIPPLPGIVVPTPVADPLVNMPTDITGTPGSTVTVPVNIDNADLLESVVLKISYDTNLLDVTANGVRTGSLTAGGSLLVNVDDAAGTINVSLLTKAPLSAGSGSLLGIDFQIRSDAVAGTTPIDLQSLSLNEGQLVLTVDPVPGGDGTDGRIRIVSSATVPSGFIESVGAQTLTTDATTVTHSVSPTTASESIDTLMTVTSFSVGVKYGMRRSVADGSQIRSPSSADLESSELDKNLSRAVAVFDMPSIGFNDSSDSTDNSWISADEMHRRFRTSSCWKTAKIELQ
jgi:hypothetical protein